MKSDALDSVEIATALPLLGRVAIVTGAGGLLGREHAAALRDAGADVALLDLSVEQSQECADQLPDGPGDLLSFGADVVDPASLERVRDALLERFGRIDVLVNNAAMNDRVEAPAQATHVSRFEHFPLDEWRRAMDVNVTGVFLPSQIFGTPMAERGAGSIINVASTYALVGPDPSLYRRPDGTTPFVKSPSYPTSKAAVIGFTRFLAAYWGAAGVRVNALAPGGVENGQPDYFIMNYARRTPLGRMADRGDFRGAIVFLASDAASYVTGATLVVDGGFTAW